MTCIIGYMAGGKIYMGGDSAVITKSGDSAIIRTMTEPPKVFKTGEWLIGFSGTPRFGQILRDCFHPTPIGTSEDVVKYLTETFVKELIETLDKLKYLEIRNGEASCYPFLIGTQGRIFKIGTDLVALEVKDDFTAIGSGEEFALGALDALENYSNLTVKQRIANALRITAKYHPYVREPFTIIES